MPKASKFSPDEGLTIYDLKDNEAVHYGEQSKGYVGKNKLCPPYSHNSYSYRGITYTFDNNGVLDIDGTSEGRVEFDMKPRQGGRELYLPVGNYTYTLGINTTPYGENINIQIGTTQNGAYKHIGNSHNGILNFSITEGIGDLIKDGMYGVGVYIAIENAGITFNHVKVYPMIRLASIPDSTYESYLTPNTEIDNKVSYKINGDLGAKNLIPFPYEYTSRTDAGVTYTIQADGGVKIEGTSSAASEIRLMGRLSTDPYKMLLNPNQYILSNNFDLTGTGIEIALGGTKNNAFVHIYPKLQSGTEVTVTITDTTVDQIVDGKYVIALYVRVEANKTYDTVVYPMLRYADDKDNTYHRYAMTNIELTNKIKELTDLVLKERVDEVSINDNNLKEYTFSNVNKIISAQFAYNEDLFYTLNTDQAFPVITLEGNAGKITITLNKKVTRTFKVKIFYY